MLGVAGRELQHHIAQLLLAAGIGVAHFEGDLAELVAHRVALAQLFHVGAQVLQ